MQRRLVLLGSCSLNTDLYSLEGHTGPKGEEQRQWENPSGTWVTGIKLSSELKSPWQQPAIVAKPGSLGRINKEAVYNNRWGMPP